MLCLDTSLDQIDLCLKITGEEVGVGFKFGPTWTTHWFQVDISIPKNCLGETEIVLRFNPTCEALLWSADGQPIKGVISLLTY